MLVFPNSKINLGLRILDKRADGFHNLETVFYPVPLRDALELIPNINGKNEIEFTGTGLVVDTAEDDNLCVKACRLLKKDFPQIPPVKIHLHKAIPLGAGLGGGSADAAFMLTLLNNKFHLNLSTSQLVDYSLQLGSDCPFFISNKPCYATGRGDLLQEISVDLSAYKIILINPGIHINTGWAFSQLARESEGPDGSRPSVPPRKSTKDIIQQPIETWKGQLKNDFETPVFTAHPAIKTIRDHLYDQGAVYAAMSGSGSTVFGIFNSGIDISSFETRNYFIKIIN